MIVETYKETWTLFGDYGLSVHFANLKGAHYVQVRLDLGRRGFILRVGRKKKFARAKVVAG